MSGLGGSRKITEASGAPTNPIELQVYPDTLDGFDDADVDWPRLVYRPRIGFAYD